MSRFELDQGVFDGLAPDQRRAALRAMAEMAGGHRDNPLWRFDPLDPSGSGVPHLPQHRFLSRWQRDGKPVKYRLFVGGTGRGRRLVGIWRTSLIAAIVMRCRLICRRISGGSRQ